VRYNLGVLIMGSRRHDGDLTPCRRVCSNVGVKTRRLANGTVSDIHSGAPQPDVTPVHVFFLPARQFSFIERTHADDDVFSSPEFIFVFVPKYFC
jgi:hypothetical protein